MNVLQGLVSQTKTTKIKTMVTTYEICAVNSSSESRSFSDAVMFAFTDRGVHDRLARGMKSGKLLLTKNTHDILALFELLEC